MQLNKKLIIITDATSLALCFILCICLTTLPLFSVSHSSKLYGICIFSPPLVTSQHGYQEDENTTEDSTTIMQLNKNILLQVISTVEIINARRVYETNRNMYTCQDILNLQQINSNYEKLKMKTLNCTANIFL